MMRPSYKGRVVPHMASLLKGPPFESIQTQQYWKNRNVGRDPKFALTYCGMDKSWKRPNGCYEASNNLEPKDPVHPRLVNERSEIYDFNTSLNRRLGAVVHERYLNQFPSEL